MRLRDSQTKKLLEFSGQIKLKQLAMNMALTRLKGLYKQNPTPSTISKCTSDLNALLQKFASIMKDDYEWIVSL
ncbi:MAG: hypothetical protein LBT44_05995 [Clostridiales bacterium]|jgi:hypothetical protein|nr:hypothetical protein [Clostridiales bacterium]